MSNLCELLPFLQATRHLSPSEKLQLVLKYHPDPHQFFAQGIIGCYQQETITGDYRNTEAMTAIQLESKPSTHGTPRHPLEIKNITALILSYIPFIERMSTERTSATFVEGSQSPEANEHCHINENIAKNLHSLSRLLRCKDLEIDYLPDADHPKIQQLKKCKGIQRLWIEDASFVHKQTSSMKFVQLMKSVLENNAETLLSLNINNLGVATVFFRLLASTQFPKLEKLDIQDCYSGWKYYIKNCDYAVMSAQELQLGVVKKCLPSLNELTMQNLKSWPNNDKGRFIWDAIQSDACVTIGISSLGKEFNTLTQIIEEDKETTAVTQMECLQMSINCRVSNTSVKNLGKMCVSPLLFPTTFAAACIIFQGSDLNYVTDILSYWKKKFQHLRCEGKGFASLRKFVCVGHSQFMPVKIAHELCESLIIMFKINNKIDFHAQLSWVICQDVNNGTTTKVIMLLAQLGKILAEKDGLVSMKVNCKVQYSYFTNDTETLPVIEEKFKQIGYQIVVPSHINEVLYPTATYTGSSFTTQISLNAFGQQVELNCPSI